MEHAENTKKNDAVTKRQVHRFLQKADVPNAWKSKLKNFKDIIDMPIVLQDKFFADFITQHLKPSDDDFPSGKPYPNDQYLMKQMSIQRLYRDQQYEN